MSPKLLIAGAALVALSATPALATKHHKAKTPYVPSGPIPYAELQRVDRQMASMHLGGADQPQPPTQHHRHHAARKTSGAATSAPR